jgi:hypothetical protein
MLKSLTIGAALLALAAPLAAQTGAATSPPTQPGSQDDPGTPRTPLPADRGYDKPQVRTEAINAQARGDVAAANANTGAAGQADLQVQYDADMASWLDTMSQRDRTIVRNAREHASRQRAYADAMYVWRAQVRDCERGYQFACNRPTPNPADFMR